MSMQNLLQWAPRKGVDLLGTGDCLHTGWNDELSEHLVEDGSGLLRPKQGGALRFVLMAEVEAVFDAGEREARIHLLVALPGFDAASHLRTNLKTCADLDAEAVPCFKMPPAELVERILNACPEALIGAAHIWNPCSSVYGSKNGFSSLKECFGDLADEITWVETGSTASPICFATCSSTRGSMLAKVPTAPEIAQVATSFRAAIRRCLQRSNSA